jgi:hypothetical protein
LFRGHKITQSLNRSREISKTQLLINEEDSETVNKWPGENCRVETEVPSQRCSTPHPTPSRPNSREQTQHNKRQL